MKTETDKTKIEELKTKAGKANSDAKRRKLIAAFYEIIRDGREVSRYNKDLRKDIWITSRSKSETVTHASKSKASTFAVLDLLDVLENAKKVKEVAIKENTKNQQGLQKMIILEDNIEGIGKVKLTVGVVKFDGRHIQYCLTALK